MGKRNRKMKLTAALMAFGIAVSVFTGCGRTDTPKTPQKEEEPKPSQKEDQETGIAQGGNGDVLAFRPAENGIPAQERYEYPYMGMTAVLTEALQDKMESEDVIMLSSEEYIGSESIKYAALYWYALTEEQKAETVTAFDPEAWRAGLEKIGVLGVYHIDSIGGLDALTGCTQHKELGKSADGNYVYYLSTADGADEDLKTEVEKTEVTLTEMQKLDFAMGQTAFSEGRTEAANVGDFKTTDINGKSYTKDLFKEYDLTLVNVFTTWCSACISEMPELEEFKRTMGEKGINIVGIVYDAVNQEGETEQSVIDMAKLLQKKAKLTFPLLIPDETDMNGRLKGINGYPESFFVDKDGNIVGETYVGARSFEEWKEIAEKELGNLQGAVR